MLDGVRHVLTETGVINQLAERCVKNKKNWKGIRKMKDPLLTCRCEEPSWIVVSSDSHAERDLVGVMDETRMLK